MGEGRMAMFPCPVPVSRVLLQHGSSGELAGQGGAEGGDGGPGGQPGVHALQHGPAEQDVHPGVQDLVPGDHADVDQQHFLRVCGQHLGLARQVLQDHLDNEDLGREGDKSVSRGTEPLGGVLAQFGALLCQSPGASSGCREVRWQGDSGWGNLTKGTPADLGPSYRDMEGTQ